MDNQNFAVARFKLKGPSLENHEFEVLCAHFKSKDDGFSARKRLGSRMNAYIKHIKEQATADKNKKLNIIIMGDLNAEVNEIAFDLDAKIRKWHFKGPKNPQLGDWVTFRSFAEEFEAHLRGLTEKVNTDFKNVKEGKVTLLADEAKALNDLKNVVEEMTNELEPLKKAMSDSTAEENLLPLIEANNFTTERKIRVGELEFKNEKYIRALLTVKLVDDLGSCGAYLNKAIETTITNLPSIELLKQSFETAVKDSIKSESIQPTTRQEKRKAFEKLYRCVKGVPEPNSKDSLRDKTKPAQTANWKKAGDVLDKAMFEEEKIDFILLDFQSNIGIKFVTSVKDYEQYLNEGIPNMHYSTDHFPSFVMFQISNDGSFKNDTFMKFAEQKVSDAISVERRRIV